MADELEVEANPSACWKFIASILGFRRSLATRPPLVITGDNYENQRVVRQVEGQKGQLGLYDETVHINVFNISKLNAEVRGGKGGCQA